MTDDAVSYTLPCGPPSAGDLCAFAEVTIESVCSMLSRLNPLKAPGPDGILPFLLKSFASVLAPSLTLIFNRSLHSGVVPSGFKKANIAAVPKNNKGDLLALSNYRPISLTAVLSKVLEKLVQLQLEVLFESPQPLDDLQFGFRRQRSAAHLLTKAVNDWLLARDYGLTTAVVFIDLSKTFDRVRHQPLLLDLHAAGVCGSALAWFASYLSGRCQRVVSSSGTSSYLPVTRGVPQGSVLGPFLFNLFVAHLPRLAAEHAATLLLFADDKTLYSSHRSLACAAASASCAIGAIADSLEKKGLSLNQTKTVSMFIQPPRGAEDAVPVIVNSAPLQVVSTVRCLGVMIDDKLTWQSHIDFIAAKVGRKIGVLRRVRRQLSQHARRLYLQSVIMPDIEYCAVAFLSSLPAKGRNRLLSLFRRALRAVAGANPCADCVRIIRNLKLEPLLNRWLLQLCSFVFVCCKHPPAACLAGMFSQSSATHATRGLQAGNLVIPVCNRISGYNSVTIRLSLLWNALPNDLKSCSSLPVFRKSLLRLLSDPQAVLRLSSLVFDSFM